MSSEVMTITPLMRQYHTIKQQYPDALLLFQVGDFYELFFEDAKKASSFLGIALTARGSHEGEPIPLCGVPVHTLDHYLVKLVRGGFRVAICDQLTPATPGKVVERGVTNVLTPGTLTDPKLLSDKSASYIAALYPQGDSLGLVFVELLAGQLCATALAKSDDKMLEAELARFAPDEIIIPQMASAQRYETVLRQLGYVTTCVETTALEDFVVQMKQAWIARETNENHVVLFERLPAALAAGALIFAYLKKNQSDAVDHVRQISAYSPDDFLIMDAATQKNLELIKNSQDATVAHSLFSVLDKALTAMGSRTIKKWLMRPLVKLEAIVARHQAVEVLLGDLATREALVAALQQVGDLERIVGRIALRRAQMHDYLGLRKALAVVPEIRMAMTLFMHDGLLKTIYRSLEDFSTLTHMLNSALNDDPSQEWKIKSGYNSELDRLRQLVEQGAHAIAELERNEQQRTGINSLKIRYHNVYGYAAEITKTHIESVPTDYIRLQTLVNRERYTFQALRDLEYDISRARTDSQELENELYNNLKLHIERLVAPLKRTAHALAHLDALLSFATSAYNYGYIKPEMMNDGDIVITEGKHPVVAASLGHAFIANDTCLTNEERLWIITGPNMGGKSTYLRQVALLTIMAQVGSFVPARHAALPIVDRIFTRIGAADNVAAGKSTFLVEMEETALICNLATSKSLVILDEVGRGTSTFDGLAIAQAVVEYIYTHVKARCLFATHYHELTKLSYEYSGIVCYHAASEQRGEHVLLLHKICKGVAQGSFGIEVARMAHLPQEVVVRAQELIATLHKQARLQESIKHDQRESQEDHVFQLQEELAYYKKYVARLKTIDFNTLSPKQAFDILWEYKESGI